MGKTYTVPRSAKGESRILYIFTIKSLVITLVIAGLGWIVASIIETVVPALGMVGKLIVTGVFGVIGYIIGSAKIPDSPLVGFLQKASGEAIIDILYRYITFKGKKKLYIYGITRKSMSNSPTTLENKNSKSFLESMGIKK